jgi:hypothetical protein
MNYVTSSLKTAVTYKGSSSLYQPYISSSTLFDSRLKVVNVAEGVVSTFRT